MPLLVGLLQDWADAGALYLIAQPLVKVLNKITLSTQPPVQSHACLFRDRFLEHHQVTSQSLCADDPWADATTGPMCMVGAVKMLACLVSISARFAARLVHAGALTVLMFLTAKIFMQPGRAGRHAAGADATSDLAKAIRECIGTFERSVPGVSQWQCHDVFVLWLHICAC